MSNPKVKQVYTYSGVLDYNGIEIKDGDFVTVGVWADKKQKHLVRFNDGAFRFAVNGIALSSWVVNNFHVRVAK